MTKEWQDFSLYAKKVSEDARKYTLELHRENQRLRELLATQDVKKLDQKKTPDRVQELSEGLDTLSAQVALLELERDRLNHQFEEVSAELVRVSGENEKLIAEIRNIEVENGKLAEQSLYLEEQISNLANLYVSSYQIHGSLRREEILTALSETIINLIGSERFGIYEATADPKTFSLISSFGLDTQLHSEIKIESTKLEEHLSSGTQFLAGMESEKFDFGNGFIENLVVFLPLLYEGVIKGIIVIYNLLPQKNNVEEIDLELFDLLSTHAPIALYVSELYEKS